jgi:hypothetical protein
MLRPWGTTFLWVSSVTEDLIGTGSHAALPAFHARQRSFTARIPEELTQLLEVKQFIFETKIWLCLVASKILKTLQDSPSHRMFGRMHETLNIGKK